MVMMYSKFWIVLSFMLTISIDYVHSEELLETVKNNHEIFNIPMLYLSRVMKEPIKWYKDNFSEIYDDMMRSFVSFINSGEITECAKTFYITEGNLLEILIRELLNNMHLTKENGKNIEIDSCNKIQNWIEYLINKSKNEFCADININYKLFDIISVLCKQTNRQVKSSVEYLKDIMQSQEQLTNECVQAIVNDDYKTAERKLKLISDGNTEFIVKKVYNSTEENFEKVLKFFSNIGNIRKSFIAYKFLYESIENSVLTDGWKLYTLYENLNKIYNYKTYPNIEQNVVNMRKSLKYRLSLFVADELMISYKDNSSLVLPETYILADIYRNFKHLYTDGLKMFLNQLCKNATCGATNLMNFARRRNYYGEIIIGLKTINEEFKLSDEEKLTLGQHVYYLSNIHYKSSQKDKLKILKENLPISIKHLLFSKYVCIRNIAYNEYLWADNNTNYNKTSEINNERLLFTAQTPYRHLNQIWILDNVNNNSFKSNTYRIRNLLYNETLYASHNFDYNYHSKNRKISVKNLNVLDVDYIEHGLWQIEPYGDNCYIKNNAHNTYMYVADEIYENNKRIAFTWITNLSKINAKNFQWIIEDCSD